MAMFKNIFLASAAAAIVAPAFASVEWMTDFEAAKAKSVAENKPMLIDFTGSDWCTWCIKLKQDVLSKTEFEQYIADKFIPVEVDVPQNAAKVGGEEQLEKNRQICEEYGVEGFPTVMVVTPEGGVAGGIGHSVDMEEALQLLDTALINVETLEKAKSLLADSQLSVNEVASRLGFNYPNHFTRFFRNATGVSPSEFRQGL